MAKKNSINNKSGSLSIDPGASGDSFVQFAINGTDEFIIGADSSEDDSFKISPGGILGFDDHFVLTSDGSRTLPLQCCFIARLNSTLSDVTGNGINYGPIIFDGVTQDRNGDYNDTTGIFTAPISGVYMFLVSYALSGIGAVHPRGTVFAVNSKGHYYFDDLSLTAARNVSNEFSSSRSIITEMDAMDTIQINILVSGAGKTIDVVGDSGEYNKSSFFSGFLLS